MSTINKFILFLVLSVYFINCQNQKAATKNNISKLNWTKADSIIRLNTIMDSFWISSYNNDSNIVFKQFIKCYDSLDVFAEKENFSSASKIQYYNKFYKIVQNAIVDNKQDYLITKKIRLLKYLIYINKKYNYNENVIQYFNELKNNSLWSTISDMEKLDRMHELGNAYNQIGEDEKTSLVYKETLSLANKINSYNNIAKVTVNINKLIGQQNLYDSIINLSNAIVEKDIEQKLKASLYQSLANAYIEKKDFSNSFFYNEKGFKALQLIDSAKRPFDFDLRLSNAYSTQAYIYEKKGDVSNAAKSYNKAIEILSNYQNGETRDLGKLYISAGKFKSQYPKSSLNHTPITYYNKALKALQPDLNIADSLVLPDTAKLEAENVYFEALDAKANYLLPSALTQNNLPQLQKLLAHYKISFQVEKQLLNNFIYDNAKIDFIDESKKRTANALKICYVLFANTKNQEWLNAAFQFIENNKATVLLDKLKKNKVLNQTLISDKRIKELAIIKKRKDKLEPESIEFKKALSEIEKLEYQLEKDYPQLNNNYRFANNVNIASTQKFLKNNTAIIDYFYFDSTLLYLYVSKTDVFLKSQKMLESEIFAFQKNCGDIALQQNEPSVFFESSNNIYKNIFPANIESTINEIIIIPDGAINNICFEALATQTATLYNVNSFLINRFTFSYCYSYASILEKNDFNEVQNKILICTPASEQKINNQEVLNNTIDEATKIKQNFKNAKWLNNTEATKNSFLTLNPSFNILHLATHSTADTVGGNSYIEFVDGPLNANSFYSNATIKPNLVFLSACATSQGKLTSNEGVLSMARSVYYAGAQNVIASQWKVNDASTALIVRNFYNTISTKNYANSLRDAKLQYIKTAISEKKLPYYWAPFVHIGYQKQYKSFNYNWLVLLVLSFFVLAILLLIKKRNPTK